MHSFLVELLGSWDWLGYVGGFLAMVIEGDGPLFVFGFLTQQGVFNLPLMAVSLYAGTVVGDALWYLLGRHFLTRSKFLQKWTDKLAKPFDDHLRDHPFRTIFLSQFVYGIHHALWVRMGHLNLDLKRLVKIDLITSLVWVVIVGGLGYWSGFTLLPIGKYVKYTEYLLLGGLVVFVVFQHYIDRVAKKNL